MHVGGAGVAEEMAGAGFVDAAVFEEFFDPVAEVVGAESLAVAGEEEGGFVGQVVEVGAGFGKEAGEPGGGVLTDGEEPVFAAFAFADVEGLGGGVVIA